jgi:hypothetical protein
MRPISRNIALNSGILTTNPRKISAQNRTYLTSRAGDATITPSDRTDTKSEDWGETGSRFPARPTRRRHAHDCSTNNHSTTLG